MIASNTLPFIGMAYAIVGSVGVALLYRSGRFNLRTGYLFLAVSTLIGFLLFAPMLPYQLQTVLTMKSPQGGQPTGVVVAGLALFVVLGFIFGRTFCGYLCPIGALQELLSRVTRRRKLSPRKRGAIAFRLVVFVAFVLLAATASVGLLDYVGVSDFYHLSTSSVSFYVFAGIALSSLLMYRPFCRFLCPYGAVLHPVAVASRFKLRRNENCTECGKCEEAYPTGEAGRGDTKGECYLCDRCREVCPVDAVGYGR